MSTLSVRPLANGDIATTARLYGRCFEEPWAEASIRDLLRTPGCWGLLASTDPDSSAGNQAGIVGFVLARVIAREGEILAIGTDPDHQRNGVARLLMKSAVAMAAGHADAFFLEVGRDNPAGQALYTGLGFAQVGLRKDYYRRADRRRVDALILRLDITGNTGR